MTIKMVLVKLTWYHFKSDFKWGDLIYRFDAIDLAFHKVFVRLDILIIQIEASYANSG